MIRLRKTKQLSPELPGVYGIFHTHSGKVYVGSAKNLQGRERAHWLALRKGDHNSILLQRAYNKYGRDCFELRILELTPEPTRKQLQAREQHWMDKYQSYTAECGYNVCVTAYTRLGMRHTEETKQKLRGKRSEAVCKAISVGVRRALDEGHRPWNLGVHWDDVVKSKIAMSIKRGFALGRSHPRPNAGKKLSAAWRKKMSQGHKRFHDSGGTVWNKGKRGAYTHSIEVRRLIAERVKAWWGRRQGAPSGV